VSNEENSIVRLWKVNAIISSLQLNDNTSVGREAEQVIESVALQSDIQGNKSRKLF
jgi:hypothetical protein